MAQQVTPRGGRNVALMPCPYCGEFAMRSHQLRCLKRRLQCPGCLSDVSAAAYEAHVAQCPEGEIRCPGCRDLILRRQLEQHLRCDCTASSHRCPECGQAFFSSQAYLKHTTPRCAKQVVSCQLCHELFLASELPEHLADCSQRAVTKARAHTNHQQQQRRSTSGGGGGANRSISGGELSPWEEHETNNDDNNHHHHTNKPRSRSTTPTGKPRKVRTPSSSPPRAPSPNSNGNNTTNNNPPSLLSTNGPVIRQLHLDALNKFSSNNAQQRRVATISPNSHRSNSPRMEYGAPPSLHAAPASSSAATTPRRHLYVVPQPGSKRNTTTTERSVVVTPRGAGSGATTSGVSSSQQQQQQKRKRTPSNDVAASHRSVRDRSKSPMRYSSAPASRLPSPNPSAPASRQISNVSNASRQNPVVLVQTFAMLPRAEQVQLSKDLRLAHLSQALRKKEEQARIDHVHEYQRQCGQGQLVSTGRRFSSRPASARAGRGAQQQAAPPASDHQVDGVAN